MERLDALRDYALGEIGQAADLRALEALRARFLGRKDGEVTELLRSLKDLPVEERRTFGPKVQALREELETALGTRAEALGGTARASVDITAPGTRVSRGHMHPLTQIDAEIRRIFLGMNFSVVEGPEVESERYNFDMLNIPPNHPARDMWDTFWLRSNQDEVKDQKSKIKNKERLLLRTHTSPMQVRYMETHEPPLQIIVPGRVFRYEATDASHEANFYQLEGLMVGKDVSLANFKYVVETFLSRLFQGKKIEFRYRPSYFPFTEPSVEVDMKFKGKWLEMMGAGMVHPRVFEAAHYNPRDYQGFAFGVGIDRLAMLKYNVPDVRLFYSGDLRFIRQF